MSSTGIPTERLQRVVLALGIRTPISVHNPRRSCLTALQTYASNIVSVDAFPVLPQSLFLQYEKFKKSDLIDIAMQHGLSVSRKDTVDSLKSEILLHVASGVCEHASSVGCQIVREEYSSNKVCDSDTLLIHLFTMIVESNSTSLLKCVLTLHNISFSPTNGIGQLHRHLKRHIASLKCGKQAKGSSRRHQLTHEEVEAEHIKRRENIQQNWPQPVSSSLKEKILQMFLEQTSSAALASFTCASCAGNYLKKDQKILNIKEIDLTLLCTSHILPSSVPFPVLNHNLRSENPSLLLDPSDLVTEGLDSPSLLLNKLFTDDALLSAPPPPLTHRQEKIKKNKNPPTAARRRGFRALGLRQKLGIKHK